MRSSVIWLVVVACGQPAEMALDASDGVSSDASPPVACGQLVPFEAAEAADVVSDNTSLFISVQATDGTMQIITTPLAGGLQGTLVTGTEVFVIDAYDDAFFYNVRVGQTYELHQRVAGVDTVLGTVPADGRIELEANATDLYVLGKDGVKTKLWRLSRSGGGGNGPTPAATTVNGTGAGLVLGETVAVFRVGSDVQIVSLPGPSTPTVKPANPLSSLSFVGDLGFGFAAGMVTQNTKWANVVQFWPGDRVIWGGMFYMELPGPIFTDDKYIYIERTGKHDYMTTDGMVAGSVCNESTGRFDKTRLIGLLPCASGACNVSIVAKPI